jgi:(E)-4-hydroxy-3-methylbut-2-enyl-diphosphate synthase
VDPVAPVFIDGRLDRTLRGEGLVDEFIEILEAYVDRRYGPSGQGGEAIPADT